MFGIDSPELLVIAIVALVVIGPKELPGLLRTWGRWMAQMRGMASEFRGHVDEMVRQSELDEVKKQLTSAASALDIKDLDPTKEIKSAIEGGMAEGEKALADARGTLDQAPAQPVADALAEPESAPQIAAEPAPQDAAEPAPVAVAEAPSPVVESTPAVPAQPPVSEEKVAEAKPAKAAAE